MKEYSTKIHLISLTDMPNGAENVLLMMANAVKGNLIFAKSSKTTRLNIPYDLNTAYLSHNNIFIGLVKLVPKLKKIQKHEIVVSTHPYLNALLGMMKRMGYLKAQLIVRECTSVFTRFTGIKKLVYQIIYKLGYPATNLVICQTDMMRTQFLEHNSYIDQKRVIVQPNPIDFNRVISLAEKSISQDELESEFICAAGRLIPEKGFDILIEAFKIVHKSKPNLKLLLLGEGKEKESLLELIERYDLQDVVLLKGHISNPAPYFKHAKVCVVSSIKEGFPNVLLEMMALNPNVVSTLCAGGINTIPNITKVEVNNVEVLARAIQNRLTAPMPAATNPHLAYLKERSPNSFVISIFSALAAQS